MLKALYGMMKESFRNEIESIIYKVNTYYHCLANKPINGRYYNIPWHVDDAKASNEDPKVNDDFYKWYEENMGTEKMVT